MSPDRAARPALPALVGGVACLDFANTVGPRRPEPGVAPHDYVPGYRELVAWAAHAGLLTAAQRRRLTAAAAADPEAAEVVHQRAQELREATYQAFAAFAQGEPVPAAALATIQDVYLAALRHARLAPAPAPTGAGTGAGLDWRWPTEPSDGGPLEQVLWLLARSAVDLALSDQVGRIKQCPGDEGRCGWLFVDTSKNATRRWCSMRSCGSRVKSQRQAARRRATAIAR